MSRINSKKKGSKNERDVCKWWKDWTSYPFARVPSSGGLRWARTSDTTGDIMCSDNKHFLRFQFSIEAKSYKDINFEHTLITDRSKVLEFWEQAVSDGERGGKYPILMMRYNGMKKGEYFFCVSDEIFQIMRGLYNFKSRMCIVSFNHTIHVLMASEVTNVDYKELYSMVKKLKKKKR